MSSTKPPSRAGVRLSPSLWEAIRQAYSHPGRAYHDLQHIEEVLEKYDEVARDVGWKHPAEVFVALLFHDFVYIPGRFDNEERSANVAVNSLKEAGFGDLDTGYIQRLILLTARHGRLEAAKMTEEEALFVDCDMSIIGADARRFAEYDDGIRAEYSQMEREVFNAGRRAFVQRLFGSSSIFLSEYFRQRLEAAARSNLESLVAQR